MHKTNEPFNKKKKFLMYLQELEKEIKNFLKKNQFYKFQEQEMYLEFKDSFHYINGHFERWNNAVDMLNDYIEQNPNGENKVEIISYKVIYLPDKQLSQTCILAHFVGLVKR